MVPSTLYSLSFLIGLSAAFPGYHTTKCSTTPKPKPKTTTCTGGAVKYTTPVYHSSKGGYPHETSKYPHEPYPTSTGYHGGHDNSTYSVTIAPEAPETTYYPSVDPFPDTTTSDDFSFTDEPTGTFTDEPTATFTDEPTPTQTNDVPAPTETLVAPGPTGEDVVFGIDRDLSIEGSVFDQSEVPQQAIDDGIALDFCAQACAISEYLCEAFELYTNEIDVLVCALKFDLGGLTDAPGSISGVIVPQ